jgi:eukaryotic-like serine/threonine-protein kinase
MIGSSSDIQVFINNKHREIIQAGGIDNGAIFIDFYNQFSNHQVREIFSTIHYNLNSLFKYMNRRLSNGRYTAGESRQLIFFIEEIKKLKANLRGTPYDFEVNEHYQEKLNECNSFLQESNGSSIPQGFEKIEIIEAKPIFIPNNTIPVVRGNVTEAYSLQMVGTGSYATVYKYKDDYYDRLFALKRAHKDLTDKERQRFKVEFEVMKRLNSPYVIEVYKYNGNKQEYIMEFADATLHSYISQNNNKIPISERVSLVRQITRAFIYINTKGVLLVQQIFWLRNMRGLLLLKSLISV